MKCGVIRGLWGDVLHQRHGTPPPKAYASILEEVKRTVQAGEQTDRVYVYGKQNYQYCRWLGLPVVMLGEEPYQLPQIRRERGPMYGGMVLWGVNHAWHKWDMFLKGLEEFDAVVWVDWDMRQEKPIDTVWWQKQADYGVNYRATLIRQGNFAWASYWRRRPKHGRNREASYLSMAMGCSWCNDRTFIERCKTSHGRRLLEMSQQQVCRQVDAQVGQKWVGVDRLTELGYAADFLWVENQIKETPADSLVWRVLPRQR